MALNLILKKHQLTTKITTFLKATKNALFSISFYLEGGGHNQYRHGRREGKAEERKQIGSVEDPQTAQ